MSASTAIESTRRAVNELEICARIFDAMAKRHEDEARRLSHTVSAMVSNGERQVTVAPVAEPGITLRERACSCRDAAKALREVLL